MWYYRRAPTYAWRTESSASNTVALSVWYSRRGRSRRGSHTPARTTSARSSTASGRSSHRR
eukprot:673841-Pyramimonas_sp.AAC.1